MEGAEGEAADVDELLAVIDTASCNSAVADAAGAPAAAADAAAAALQSGGQQAAGGAAGQSKQQRTNTGKLLPSKGSVQEFMPAGME